MSTIKVSNITTPNSTIALTLDAGPTAGKIVIDNHGVYFNGGASFANALTITPGQMSILANNSYGNPGQLLTSFTGTPTWSSIAAVNVQTFTTSGTWTKPLASTFALVQMWGGGGGGSCGANVALATGGTSLGGGGGGYSKYILQTNSLTSTVSVTIGAGGIGNNIYVFSGPFSPGSNGGYTAFGGYANAYGGLGGSVAPSNRNTSGGNSSSYISYAPYTNTTVIANVSVYVPSSTATPGMQTFLGGLVVGTINTVTNGINTSVFGGGATVANTQSSTIAGNSVWGGGAGGSSMGNTTVSTGSNGGISIFGGNGGASGNSTTATQAGFFPSGGGGGGLVTTTTTVNSATSGANGGNGYCIVIAW